MYMLDTNICIYVIKNKPTKVLQRFKDNIDNGLCISVITLAELMHGVEKNENYKKNAIALCQFLSIIEVLPFDCNSATEYGKICAYLQKCGMPIGTMDMLIASHALSQNMTLVTNNVREFERIPNLVIENWVNLSSVGS